MLKLWHHVGAGPARALLFEDFVLEGRPLGLIEAIVVTAEERHWRGRLPRGRETGAGGWAVEAERLEQAFARSLVEVLGGLATPMVRRAWQDALRVLLRQNVADPR